MMQTTKRYQRVIEFFGLKKNIVALLVMVILVGMGEKMAERFLPLYLIALGGGTFSIGLLNGLDNLLSALYSLPGGYASRNSRCYPVRIVDSHFAASYDGYGLNRPTKKQAYHGCLVALPCPAHPNGSGTSDRRHADWRLWGNPGGTPCFYCRPGFSWGIVASPAGDDLKCQAVS